MRSLQRILSLLHTAEKLKTELRHSWLSNNRQESVAEHTWRMSLMAMLLHKKLKTEIDLEKTLKMIIVHDLVEAYTGDVPFFEKSQKKDTKKAREDAAIEKIREVLGDETGQEIYDLWHEFENRETNEAKFAYAIDNLEVQLQHNEADLSTWLPVEYELVYTKMDKPCSFDETLTQFCQMIKDEAEGKLKEGGVDVKDMKKKTH